VQDLVRIRNCLLGRQIGMLFVDDAEPAAAEPAAVEPAPEPTAPAAPATSESGRRRGQRREREPSTVSVPS